MPPETSSIRSGGEPQDNRLVASQPSEKEQPWRKFFNPEEASIDAGDNLGNQPWLNWKPDPGNPDEKPWISWVNDPKYNPEKRETDFVTNWNKAHPLRRRASGKATVAEGG